MRDRHLTGAFLALIFAIPALIVLATSISTQSLLQLAAVEGIVCFGLIFASWARAYLRRPRAFVPIRIATMPPRPRVKHPARTVA